MATKYATKRIEKSLQKGEERMMLLTEERHRNLERSKAIANLDLAKKLEQNLLRKGYRWVHGGKTKRLVRPITDKCNNVEQYHKSVIK